MHHEGHKRGIGPRSYYAQQANALDTITIDKSPRIKELEKLGKIL